MLEVLSDKFAIKKKQTRDEERIKRNKELVERMKQGDSCTLYGTKDTWYPDRSKGQPKKDKDAIKRLYGKEDGKIE